MNKLIPIIVVAIAVFGIFKLLSQNPSVAGVADSEAQLILFWGDGCVHCEKVKQYISDNNLESKVKIAYKEVYYNKTNQNLLESTVAKCPEIDSSQGIGVPLAFDTANSTCLYGDQPIIDWLNTK